MSRRGLRELKSRLDHSSAKRRGHVSIVRGLQVGLLAGLGAAFVGAPSPEAYAGGGRCFTEGECTFKKPNFMIVLDYSSSMNVEFGAGTRWEAAVDAVQQLVTTDDGYFQENMRIALMRFGHDPDPGSGGTIIDGDPSGLRDGQALDVGWYDPDDDPSGWFECNGDAIVASLDATPPPLCQGGTCSGIGTWTKGALDFAAERIVEAQSDHPEDLEPGNERYYGLMLVTDGAWTDQVGFPQLEPPEQDPVITAQALWNGQGIPTYVVAVADAAGQPFAEELAQAGGTQTSIPADDPQALQNSMNAVVQDIQDQVIVPECTAGLPRVMVLLDASSSMLDVGDQAGGPGETGWDLARDALAGSGNNLFDTVVPGRDRPVEDLVHLGLAAFGHNEPLPGEQKLMIQYGPCMQDNFDWALDPETSCQAPGCTDPWGGPPIDWTFQDGSQVPPFFDQTTISHMPQCQPFGELCAGSGTYTHLGLELVLDNYFDYSSNPPPAYPIDDETYFVNILITDGQYSGYSTDAQVQNAMEALWNEGVKTFVIGFGDGLSTPEAEAQLQDMADWGSGGTENYYDANSQGELEDALNAIIQDIPFDPCCVFNDCSENPEPTTNEPDPSTGGSGSSGTTASTSGSATATSSGSGTTTWTSGTDDSGSASATDTASGTDSDSGTATGSGSGSTWTSGGDDSGSGTATDSGSGGTWTDTGGSGDDSGSGSSWTDTGGTADDSGSGGSWTDTGGSGDDSGSSATASGSSGSGSGSASDTGVDTEGGVITGFGDTGYGADLNGRGCACSTSDEGRGGTGPWSGLLALGLLGFVRRRRA